MGDISRISYMYFLMHYIKGKSSKFVEYEWHNVKINYLDSFFLETAVKEKFKEYKGSGYYSIFLDF